MGASEADQAIPFVSNSENETVRNTIDHSVGAISGFAVIKTVVGNDGENLEIDPARQRYAMLCEIDGFLGRIETSRLLYIQFVGVEVKPGQGCRQRCHVIIPSRQLSVQPL
jgi:hypothetical protein